MITAAMPSVSGDLKPFKEVCRERGINPRTAWGWCANGVRGRKLRVYRLGGRIYTTEAWLSQWLADLQDI